MSQSAFESTLAKARQTLLDARAANGAWEGELSSSALATATAVFALHLFIEHATRLPEEQEVVILDRSTERACRKAVNDGLAWLALHQNRDGGWGDTIISFSNISTTALCWAAFAADGGPVNAYGSVVAAAEKWLAEHAGACDPEHLIPAIIARYGKDKTFSVPILTMCALAGRLGEGRSAWRKIPQLPFELAAFPQRMFKWLRLPVVSYALPALIAIGLVRHVKRPSWNLPAVAIRNMIRRRTLQLLGRIQPETGGFLEATPLTSFVVMSLVGAGEAATSVVKNGITFLIRSIRTDGSWPIDTDLATWVTTLSVNALAIGKNFQQMIPEDDRRKIQEFLLGQQYRREHPYTLADPGAWAWTPLSGGVPDADDTPGAVLALRNLGIIDQRTKEAAAAGIGWLLDLQNRDGGIPTFCRGWGKLPFDRSSADLTAHTLRAMAAWKGDLPIDRAARAKSAAVRMVEYLVATQQADGSWLPLWFGNQHAPDDIDPTYGTARVLLAAHPAAVLGAANPAWAQKLSAAVDWLLAAQRPGGGWGAGHDTPPSIEETALAVEALADIHAGGIVEQSNAASHRHPLVDLVDYDRIRQAILRGVDWLIIATDRGTRFDPSPIGFYFAKLWYYEKLYPLIFTVAAMEAAAAAVNENADRAGA
ncbi:MAG TPA: prenyltransferase/squalene oxidase repeat-containing protein [Tepidisphaeraceae bacterium]|jgi:squalene-hopene/tetraprenyl-beta-curcumene cyclase|nr:prenyltransferase/squalene oxidase repeat-containing protein [Tepidisphaeraceae bacterium]